MRALVILGLALTLIYGLGSSLIPLLVAAVGALLSQPLLAWLRARGIRPPFSTLMILLGVFVPIIVLSVTLVPIFFEELKDFLAALPQYLTNFLDQVEAIAVHIGLSMDYSRDEIRELVNRHSAELSVNALKFVGDTLKHSAGNLTGVILATLNVFLIPVFFFYLVSENSYWQSLVLKLFPEGQRARFSRTFDQCVDLLKSYLQGQSLACATLAACYACGLLLVGLRFGALIGILTGALSFMPYVGFSLGLAAGVVVAFSMGKGFGFVAVVLAVFFVVQSLESFVITPRLVGNTVGLTPLESILVLIVFGNLAGFTGMLVAIPTAAILKIIAAEYFMGEKA